MAELHGTRFGSITYSEAEVIQFQHGLIGLDNLTAFLLIEHRADSPFHWLQSVQEPAMAFLVTDPTRYVTDYAPEVKSLDAERLRLQASSNAVVLTTATIPAGNPNGLTLNLAGPIVINVDERLGAQIVIDDPSVPTRFQPFSQKTVAA